MKSSRVLAAGLGFVVVLVAEPGTAAELPIACVAGTCGGNLGWISKGAATAVTTPNSLIIQQTTDKAVLNWQSFNVGADGKVIFQQPGSSSIALNRIFQNDASKIFGAVEANGQIYLVNQNGFVFGAGAKVKAGSLLVSTLNMSDAVFDAGLAAARGDTPALASDRPDELKAYVLGSDGQPKLGEDGKPLLVKLVVEEGAKISSTGASGRVMLAGQVVDNAGSIETPGGQLVLAAGDKVYLQASSDPALRGLLVEVDGKGEAWNRLSGHLDAARGNITVVGLAVNQQGRISATTTVASNGSVRLLARNGVDPNQAANGTLVATNGGTLELGSQSRIDILPDLTNTATAVDDQKQVASSIEIGGKSVMFRGGTQITAPGGTLTVSAGSKAQFWGAPEAAGEPDPDAKLRVESGVNIDLSGSDVTLPVSRALVEVELRANELKDSPLQRDGVLRGQRVIVDARVGTPLADVSGALAAVPKGIAERTSNGGSVKFNSAGDVVFNSGANVNVSGGTVHYEGGVVQTTRLLGADGKVYDIGTADPNRVYVGLINPTYTTRYDRWGVVEKANGIRTGHYEADYTEGRSAGAVQFTAPNMVLNGSLLGSVEVGEFQRDAGKTPQGGTLIIGSPAATGTNNYVASSINFVTHRPSIIVADGASLPGPRTLELPVDLLTQGGFTRTEIYSNGNVALPTDTPLNLTAGSSLSITANRVDILSDITAASGTIKVTADQTAGVPGLTLSRPGVHVGDGVTLDVRGQWTNDLATQASGVTPRSVVYKDGGTIDLGLTARDVDPLNGGLFDAEVVLGDDVSLRASGGGWMKSDGSVAGGKGGSIALRAGRTDHSGNESDLQVGGNVSLDAFGVHGASGGSFLLQAPRLEVKSGSEWAKSQRLDFSSGAGKPFFQVGSSLFSDFGFSSVSLVATGSAIENGDPAVLAVRAGTTIDARVRSIELLDSARNQASASTLAGISEVILPLDQNRPASTVSMSVTPQKAVKAGLLSVEAGSVMFADPKSTFAFSGVGGIALGGEITAHGGTIKAFVDTPAIDVDTGYQPALRIDVASTARLDVSGVSLLTINDAGIRKGSVLDAGTVSLTANRGSVVVNDGAKVDISGTADAIDFADTSIHPTYTRHTVASAAGALELRAPESIVFLGDLNAAAGVGDTGRAAGGTLSVQLTRARGWSAGEAAFPTGPRVLRITTDPIAVGANLPNGLGLLGMDTISHSGLDSLRLESSVSIELDAGVNINMARQLIVDAPVVALPGGGTVNLSAAFVSFGNSNVLTQFAPSQTAGGGLLNVHGNLIELVGSSSLQRVAKATFDSTGDIPMRGVPLDKEYVGSLNVAGDLTLRAERVYPNTATHFSLIAAGGTNDTVRLEQAATMNAALPLAVAGSVMIQGKQIVQDGTLLAPFGTLDLVASEKLQLTARSITSVSGNGGLFPFGQVQLGEWLYSVNGVPVTQNGVPTRQVTLKSDSIDFQSGATVDLRGGGDLYAYEWVPGTGGSKDALGAGVTPGLYAIVPSLGSEYAPYDPLESAGTGLNVGDSIYLSGVGDLPAGTYALLPARYALLPGAYLVQAVPNSADYAPGQTATLSDGTPVVAGYRTFGDTGIGATRYTGFAIRPGSYGKSLATYDVSLASKFFPARALRLDLDVPRGPADAASLAIVAGSSLNARGNVLTAAAEGGEGASIDVASENLEIVKTIDSTAGTVQISADVLEQWNPAHLLLGGVRASDGETVDVVSSSVVFRNGTQLSLSEVVAAALDEVSVESGASVQSGAAAAGKTVDTSKLTDKIFKLNGDDSKASMLAVSDLSLFDVKREKGGSGTPGKVSVASGSVVGSRGSLMIDAPGGGSLATSGLQGDGAAWQLGSQRIAFGTGAISDGLSIGADLFAHLQKASSVSFVASDTVDFFDSVQLGGTGSSLKQISIQASALQSVGSDIHVTLEASKIALKGATAESADPVAGTNSLHLAASELAIDEGSLSLNGFGTTTIDASTRVRGEGKASLLVAGDLTLNTGVLTTASSANVLLQSDSTVRINSTGAPTSFPVNELGGALTISGKDLLQAGNIVMPSGLVTLQASGQLSVLDGARVDVSGRQVTIGGRSGSSSGGAITLKSGGDLVVANNTALRVNGAGSSDAGDIHVNVGGSASFAGTLEAHAGTGARGGSFDLSAGQLSNFSLLNTSLESGGFNELRSVTTAQGDLVLGAGETITARSVLLEADGGTVHIAGTINALSDAERSKISLFGSNGVSLASTTTLRADGVGDSGRGGEITLGASTGRVSVAAGSLMSAAGKSEAGSIRLRAARDGNDVAIDPLLGRVEGVDAVTIEPVMAFNVSAAPTSGELTAIRDQVKAYINAAADSIRSRLKGANGLNVALEPGIELRSQGDLTLGSLDLSTWRFTTDNTPAALTVRAAGSIKINGIIQDGFDTIPPTGGPNSRLQLRDEKSSTLRFAAGAAFNSANPLALASSNLGSDFTLLTNAVVRTGTGNIDVVASHDIVFAGTGSSIYTGGRPGTGQLTLVLPSTMSFPTLGGQISLVAGHDVLGQALNQQAITAWQVRQRPNLDAAWGIDLRRFGWNVGSLGGGDVSIRAGGNVNDLSATAADSARVVDGKLIQYGGGHMSIESGGDINTSVVHVTKGYNRIEADGGLGSTRVADNSPLGSLLFMQNDANLILDARTGVLLESALNPTRINQPATVQSNARTSYFTYDPAAALNVTTAAGDLSMTYKPVKVKAIMGVTGSEVLDSDVSSLPPNLSLQALSGDVRITGSLNLVQSDFGQLNVFAARDLDLRDAGSLTMSAIPASSTPTPLQVQARGTDFQTQSPHTSSTRHAKDTQPVLITAGRDITGGEIRLPKLAQIFAGRDIVDTNVSSQNLNAGDATSIYASRDLRYTIDRLDGKIEVGGPGRLDVVAGRNVDLGFSRGITTDGRIRNPELATEQGADLTVIAGAGQPIDSSKFLTDIVAESKDYRDMLVAYVERETGLSGLTYDAALTKFQQLDSSDQRPLLLEMFFRELVGAGRDANKDPSSNFKRGYAAIDALFPGSRPEEGSTTPSPYKGDISLTFSRVYTVSGGNISLLAPGGLVNVGLANPPGTLASRPPSLLGIVAQRAGDVRIFANDDVLVNASRIFTLGGGDIAVWSTTGDIDAGRGSKSAVSAPAPVVLIDSSGQVVINFADAVQGSGIRTIAAGDDVEPGDVDLIAPAGIVNAGDAGIGAAGNLNVAASQVVGLDNIQVGGSSTGVPAETSGLGASLSGVSSVATASSAAAGSALDEGTGASQQAAPLADSALGWLDVFVEGFGEEVCKSSDIDCLERNRAKPKP